MTDDFTLDLQGLLDTEEMKVLFVQLGLDLTPAQVELIMKEIDADDSGEIDFEEFFSWYASI